MHFLKSFMRWVKMYDSYLESVPFVGLYCNDRTLHAWNIFALPSCIFQFIRRSCIPRPNSLNYFLKGGWPFELECSPVPMWSKWRAQVLPDPGNDVIATRLAPPGGKSSTFEHCLSLKAFIFAFVEKVILLTVVEVTKFNLKISYFNF